MKRIFICFEKTAAFAIGTNCAVPNIFLLILRDI